MRGNPLKAIFFDMGDTLFVHKSEDPRRFRMERISRSLQELGYDIEATTLLKEFNSVRKHLRETNPDIEFSLRCILSMAAARVGIRERLPVVVEVMYEAYKEAAYEDLKLEEGARDAILELKERGFEIGIISNASDFGIVRGLLKKERLYELLDALAVSANTVWKKPNRRIFEYALREAGVKAYEAMHVGDSLRSDVFGAKNVGMMAVWKAPKEDSSLLEKAPVRPDIIIRKIKEILEFIE